MKPITIIFCSVIILFLIILTCFVCRIDYYISHHTKNIYTTEMEINKRVSYFMQIGQAEKVYKFYNEFVRQNNVALPC